MSQVIDGFTIDSSLGNVSSPNSYLTHSNYANFVADVQRIRDNIGEAGNSRAFLFLFPNAFDGWQV